MSDAVERKDDTELVRSYLSRGEPIPPGTYLLRAPLKLDRDSDLRLQDRFSSAPDDTDE